MTLLSPRCHCWRTFATYISAQSEPYSQTRRPISWDLWNNLNLVTLSRFNDRFSFGSISREFYLQNSYWALFSIRLQDGYKKINVFIMPHLFSWLNRLEPLWVLCRLLELGQHLGLQWEERGEKRNISLNFYSSKFQCLSRKNLVIFFSPIFVSRKRRHHMFVHFSLEKDFLSDENC